MTDKKAFGSFIKEKRMEKNYSQKELADLLFVTEGAVSKWERGVSYPDITLISDICRVLEISEHEFITASTDTTTRALKQDARRYRAIRNAWFWTPSIGYFIALFVCFIVNFAVNHTLSWFWIVLSALVCAYSFIPTFTSFFETYKLHVFVATSYCSIALLLLTCGIYTRAPYWVMTACLGVLMGYVLVFGPLLLAKTKYTRYKFLLSFGAVFVLTLLLLLSVYTYAPFRMGIAVLITLYCFAPVMFCAWLCLQKMDGFLKAGICTLLCGIVYYGVEYFVNALYGYEVQSVRVDFQNWQECTNGNVALICLWSFLFVSLVFLLIGWIRVRRGRRKNASDTAE